MKHLERDFNAWAEEFAPELQFGVYTVPRPAIHHGWDLSFYHIKRKLHARQVDAEAMEGDARSHWLKLFRIASTTIAP